MKKKWVKYYLLLGILLMVVLSALCSFTFVRGNVKQAQDKKTFESIYTDTSIDFIVPSPSYTQVGELEKDSNSGISAMVPFFETTSSTRINGNGIKGTTIIFPDEDKIEYSPYGSRRIVSGENSLKAGDAAIDRVFVDKNNVGIGDEVTLSIAGYDYSFVIRAITESNTYYNDGTIAVILSGEQVTQLQNAGIKYSAAYVSASDYDKCKTYLYNDYKPLGRLKDEAEFDSRDAYDQHVQNFNAANWTKEITNCKDNYNSLSVKYDNVEMGIYRNMIIAAIIVFMVIIVYNAILMKSEELKVFFQNYLVKKSGTKAEIKSFYKNGIVFCMVVFIMATAGLYYYVATGLGVKLISSCAFTSGIIIISEIIASLLMLLITSGYVEKHYSLKKENGQA